MGRLLEPLTAAHDNALGMVFRKNHPCSNLSHHSHYSMSKYNWDLTMKALSKIKWKEHFIFEVSDGI